MTCIIGVEHNGKVFMGGDIIGSNGHVNLQTTQSKVFKHNNMIFGYTGSFRFDQVIEHHLE